MSICHILRTFGIFYDHLVHFVFIWYIFYVFGIMCQEKSGNPDLKVGIQTLPVLHVSAAELLLLLGGEGVVVQLIDGQGCPVGLLRAAHPERVAERVRPLAGG
jgi:hypothetical protein